MPEQISFEAGSGSGIIFLTALPAAGPNRVETVELILSADGLESVTNLLEVVIEGEDSGQIVSTGFAADGQTLEIEFNSRADWKYVLGRATDVNGPWRLDTANALIGTGAVMKFLVGRTWYPGPEPSFYRVFREP